MHTKSLQSNSLRRYGLQSIRFLCPWNSPGRNTGVSCHALQWGICPIPVSNPCLLWLLHCCWILYHWATEAQSNRYMHIILHFMGIKASCFLLDFLLLSFKEPLLTVHMFSFIWWLFSVSKIICWYNSVLMVHC